MNRKECIQDVRSSLRDAQYALLRLHVDEEKGVFNAWGRPTASVATQTEDHEGTTTLQATVDNLNFQLKRSRLLHALTKQQLNQAHRRLNQIKETATLRPPRNTGDTSSPQQAPNEEHGV